MHRIGGSNSGIVPLPSQCFVAASHTVKPPHCVLWVADTMQCNIRVGDALLNSSETTFAGFNYHELMTANDRTKVFKKLFFLFRTHIFFSEKIFFCKRSQSAALLSNGQCSSISKTKLFLEFSWEEGTVKCQDVKSKWVTLEMHNDPPPHHLDEKSPRANMNI